MGERPQVTATRHTLPFESLAPFDFERLGLALLGAEGYELRHLGASGSDGGVDVVATREGRVIAVQCKRYQELGPKATAEAVAGLLARPLNPPADELLLIASCKVSREAEDLATLETQGLPLHVWAQTELDQKVGRHPEILKKFFDLREDGEVVNRLLAPAPPPTFTGREAILDELARRLTAGENVGLTALQGMGGIGKTSLAQQLALRLDAGAFPGGVVWWQLGPEPDVLSALDAWARAVDPRSDLSAQKDPQARAVAVRQLLARRGRLCAMLDDVWQAEPARVLLDALPAGTACLVTTREGDVARQLRCVPIELETLTEDEVVDLVEKLLPGTRANHEAEARRLAQLTEGLPLAVEIAIALIDAPRELAGLIQRLERKPRIEVLSPVAGRRDGLEGCFVLSYASLDPESQRRFRALGAFAAAPFDEAALAAVWGLDEFDDEGLRLLIRRHLIQRMPDGRALRVHGLLLDYARALLEREQEGEETSRRHAEYFRTLVSNAHWQVVDEAYEQVRHAWRFASRHPELASTFALSASGYQRTRGRWADRLSWLTRADEVVSARDDLHQRALVTHELARVLDDLGRKEEALRRFEEALLVRREVGDRGGEGVTLNNIAGVYDDLGRKEEALRRFEEALLVLREVGDRGVEGVTLNNIASVYADLGRKEESLRRYEEALLVAREVGDRGSEGVTLNNIAKVYDDLGRKEEALRRLEEALLVRREVGDAWGEAVTQSNRGLVLYALGRISEAILALEACVALEEEFGHPDLESDRAFLEQVRAEAPPS